jgi:carbon storage regulator
MLVLSRKIGERLFVGSDIVVTVTKIAHNKVSLGIEAPRSVTVHREELLTKDGCDLPKADDSP